MKEIFLNKNKFAIVDDEDYEYLMQWKWRVSNAGYAVRTQHLGFNGKRYGTKTISMHRVILGVGDEKCDLKTNIVDHKNRNRLDNTKDNLRICNSLESARNRNKRSSNKSGFTGVHWHKLHSKWYSDVMVDGKRIFLGLFRDKIEAAESYNKAAIKYFGEFAKLNEI